MTKRTSKRTSGRPRRNPWPWSSGGGESLVFDVHAKGKRVTRDEYVRSLLLKAWAALESARVSLETLAHEESGEHEGRALGRDYWEKNALSWMFAAHRYHGQAEELGMLPDANGKTFLDKAGIEKFDKAYARLRKLWPSLPE